MWFSTNAEVVGHRRAHLREIVLAQRERRVAHEALVVHEHRDDVLVAGEEPDRRLAVDPGLQQHRILLAHPRVDLEAPGAELLAVEVVLLRRRHGVIMIQLVADWKLKLTLEYDGLDFHGRGGQPGLRPSRARFARRSRRCFRAGTSPRSPGGRHRRPRAWAGRLGEGRRRPAAERTRRAERGAPGRRRRRRGRGGRARLPRAPLGARAELPRPHLAPTDASPFELGRSWWAAASVRRGEARGRRRRDPRRARLPRVHADRDAAPRLSAQRARRVAPTRRRARARDHGRQLPPAHGADAGRDDGRADAGGARRAIEGAHARRPGSTAPPWGPLSTSGWSTSRTGAPEAAEIAAGSPRDAERSSTAGTSTGQLTRCVPPRPRPPPGGPRSFP